MTDLPGPLDVLAAADRLRGIVNCTPVVTSRTLDALTGAAIYLKCENFQRAGAFKFRGAYHALSRLDPQQRSRGVLTYSSGNHAQAIALAGRLLSIPTTIVMPEDAPELSSRATREYGGEIVTYDRFTADREDVGAKLASARGLTVIPPYDHADVICGQGTTALELFATVSELELLLVCCGGGGLLSGCAMAASAVRPECRVIGVEPELADDATRSFSTGLLQTVHNPPTVADGARTPSLGRLTFPLVRRYVHEMVTVSEDAIVHALGFLWERLKLVAEPTGAVALAAVLAGRIDVRGRRVGVVVSGGNVDIAAIGRVLAAGSAS